MTVKLTLYEACPSAKHYLVVWQDARRILNLARAASGRLAAAEATGGNIAFDAPKGLTLALEDVYAGSGL